MSNVLRLITHLDDKPGHLCRLLDFEILVLIN